MTTTSTFRVTSDYGRPAIIADLEVDGVALITFKEEERTIRCEHWDGGHPFAAWEIDCPAELMTPADANALKHACVFLLHCVNVEAVELSAETIAEALRK